MMINCQLSIPSRLQTVDRSIVCVDCPILKGNIKRKHRVSRVKKPLNIMRESLQYL